MSVTPAKRIANLPDDERAEALEWWVGQVACVTYRKLSIHKTFDHSVVGRILATSFPRTNGNSTGDLIVAPRSESASWIFTSKRGRDVRWSAMSISLANISHLELVENDACAGRGVIDGETYTCKRDAGHDGVHRAGPYTWGGVGE